MRKVLLSICLLDGIAYAEPGEERRLEMLAAGYVLPYPAPDRTAPQGIGPFNELVIENTMLVDGLGSPPRGPVHIPVRDDRIAQISATPIAEQEGQHRIDAAGMTTLPGFVDSHAHNISNPFSPPDYTFKLWLAHGVTTIRDMGSIIGLEYTVEHQKRSDAATLTAPRIVPYSMFPGDQIVTADEARKWVRAVAKKGAKGVKLRCVIREALLGVLAETEALGLGSASHHDQNGVYHMNI